MFKFGTKKSLQIEDPEPIMRSKSNAYSLVSPRPHHSISFTSNRKQPEKPTPITNDHLKFGRKILPTDFADTLLNLEIEIELNENVQINSFQQLITLYMDGVEYYESIKDRKYVYFQRKLNGLMTKPAFLMTSAKQISPSKSETTTAESSNSNPQSELKKKEFQEQQKQLELNLIYGDSESKEAKVNQIVQSHCDVVKRIDDIIQQEIESQSDTIKKRLDQRRRGGLSRNFSSPIIVVDESTLQEVAAIQSSSKPELYQILRDASQSILPIEEEEEEMFRKESVDTRKKLEVRKILFNSQQDPKMIKRQSLLLGNDVVNQLMKRQITRKERAKSFPTKEYHRLIFKDEYSLKLNQIDMETSVKDLQEAHLAIANKYKQLTGNQPQQN